MSNRRLLPTFVLLCVLPWQVSAFPQGAETRPWSQVAIDDLHFIRAVLRENHPGPVDTENAWFRDWFETGFTAAIELAARAESYAGYYFSLQYFLNGFQDGHLGALGDDRLRDTKLRRRWPGFLVRWQDGDFVVFAPHDTTPPVPVGARLVQCDGRSAEVLAEALLRTYVGLWSVRGVRPRLAPYLLIDEGNPFVATPETCSFALDGRAIDHALEWVPIDNETLGSRMAEIDPPTPPRFELRRFGSRGYWISAPSFAGGDSATVAALQALIAEIRSNAETLRVADVIVFDVRGNGGGDSRFGDEIAAALWGHEFIAQVRPHAAGVDWRVSAGNVRFLRNVNLRRVEERLGADAPHTVEYARFVAEMEAALGRGGPLLRQSPDTGESSDSAFPNPVRARVVLLTDSRCFSACLDFADLLLSIEGVVHAGRETSADAVYIDNRSERLPSGEGRLGFSMKVYRGRPRGHNQSYVPRWRWNGRMDDTAGLERWLIQRTRSD
jgi:hypothetical protein